MSSDDLLARLVELALFDPDRDDPVVAAVWKALLADDRESGREALRRD